MSLTDHDILALARESDLSTSQPVVLRQSKAKRHMS